MKTPHLTRRRLILGGSLIGGALVVGYAATHPMQVVGSILHTGGETPDPGAFGPFIRIAEDGAVTVVNKQQEMGQGIHAGLAAMVAEELDADWDKVKVVDAVSDFRTYGLQMTAGSRSVADNWDLMRNAGAAARAMFVAAAAARWGVPAAAITVRDGVVAHPPTNRTAGFGDLLADAARQSPPKTPALKAPKDYRLIGTDRVRRKDSLSKSTGRQVYTQDVRLPRMLTAMVAHSPRFGGKLAKFDAADALRIKGVIDVVAIESGVAVLADSTWAARRGREALRIEWDDREAEVRSSSELVAWYRDVAAGQSELKPRSFQKKGDPETAFADDAVEITLDLPYLAHAPMETLDCVAQVEDGRVRIVSGSHLATVDHVQAALAGHTLPGDVEIEVLPAGGSFGRRGVMSADYLVECVRIARRAKGRPVKLIWTREDEMAAGYYRPMTHHRAVVELGPDGLPARWRHRIVSQSLLPGPGNPFAAEGVQDSPYFAAASVVDAQVYTPRLPVSVGFWRSVGNSHTAMMMEHAVDQLARRAGRDPAEYRRTLYLKAGDKRRLAVLDELCRRSNWGAPLEPGWARGLAVHEAFGTLVGQVAEVRLDAGRPVVRRVVAVVDCGIAVSPDQIAAQMEGAVGFGLSAALYGQVTLKNGLVQETNFDTYPLVRMREMPAVGIHIMPSTERPTGMGEPGVPPIAPAVANALLALTGQPTTSLPLVKA